MAQGIVQKLIGDHTRGVGNGIIRPITATGANIVGQDVFFNGSAVVSLGEDDGTPLTIGDVVAYTYVAPAARGAGMAPGMAVAVDITRIERGPQGDERGRSARATGRASGDGQDASPSVEDQLRANDIYRAI